jgi:hypothetical protein
MHPFVRFVSARGSAIRPAGGRADDSACAMLAETAGIRKTLAPDLVSIVPCVRHASPSPVGRLLFAITLSFVDKPGNDA